jgi:outer membrane protein insertion porin family
MVVMATFCSTMSAQEVVVKPTVLYTGAAHKYTIGGINLSGAENLEPSLVISLSGLSIGDVISVPGDAVTNAVKRYWKHGLFEDVCITADSIKGDYIY